MTGDMKKKLKNCFFKKCQFLHFLLKLKVKNCFLKKQLFSILIISLMIFDLQKRTIPQNKALNILFWPYFIHFTARMGIWWAMKPRKCPVFCSSDFSLTDKVICIFRRTLFFVYFHVLRVYFNMPAHHFRLHTQKNTKTQKTEKEEVRNPKQWLGIDKVTIT